MPIGCCGSRPLSLQGLLAEADFYPARSPQGQRARAKLAYGIAAGKAAQQGNMPAYRRAMEGLNGLGTFTAGTAALAAASSAVRAAATRAAASAPRPPTALQLGAQASAYVNLVVTLVNVGTNIARAAAGTDTNATNIAAAIDMIVGWIRALLTGGALTVPSSLSPDVLNGMADFCARKNDFQSPINLGLQAIVVALRGAAVAPGADVSGLTNAADAIDAIRTRIVSLLDGLCTAVTGAGGVAPSSTDCSGIANAIYDAAQGGCVCKPGFVASTTVPDQCDPAPYVLFPTPGSAPPPTVFVPFALRPTGSGSSAPKSSAAPLLAVGAGLLAWKFLF